MNKIEFTVSTGIHVVLTHLSEAPNK